MSMSEIIVILIAAILALGPDRLPGAIVQIVKIIKAIKCNVNDVKAGIGKEIRIKEPKDEARKYQDEFSLSNENIRKKLSFEEFDGLERDVLDKTKVDLTFDNRGKETPSQNPTEEANV